MHDNSYLAAKVADYCVSFEASESDCYCCCDSGRWSAGRWVMDTKGWENGRKGK